MRCGSIWRTAYGHRRNCIGYEGCPDLRVVPQSKDLIIFFRRGDLLAGRNMLFRVKICTISIRISIMTYRCVVVLGGSCRSTQGAATIINVNVCVGYCFFTFQFTLGNKSSWCNCIECLSPISRVVIAFPVSIEVTHQPPTRVDRKSILPNESTQQPE